MQIINFNQHFSGIGTLQGPPKNKSIMAVVSLVQTTLVDFSDELRGSSVQNEKGLTQELCDRLNMQAGSFPFWFDKEVMEDTSTGSSPAPDMGAKARIQLSVDAKLYSPREVFFSMEAKRLGNLGKAREKEYLIGRQEGEKYVDSGGVERFKKKLHGRNVTQGAIVGYVQTDDFVTWHSKINHWVTELIEERGSQVPPWTDDDMLTPLNSSDLTATYTSQNRRESDSIKLYHMWVELVPENQVTA